MMKSGKASRGVAATEYGILASLVAVLAIFTVYQLGQTTRDTFDESTNTIVGTTTIATTGRGYFDENGHFVAPVDTCWEGTDGDDTLVPKESTIYSCFNLYNGTDTLITSLADDTVDAGGFTGAKTISTLGGNDLVYADFGTVNLGDGDDYGGSTTGTAVPGELVFFGGAGNDSFEVRGHAYVDGGAGNDEIVYYQGGTPRVTTGPGRDIVDMRGTRLRATHVTITDFDKLRDVFSVNGEEILADSLSPAKARYVNDDGHLGIYAFNYENPTFVTFENIPIDGYVFDETPGEFHGGPYGDYMTVDFWIDADGERLEDATGHTTLYAYGGDDYVRLGTAGVTAYGGDGDDMIYPGREGGDDIIHGDAGNDTLGGYKNGSKELYGDDGNDVITAVAQPQGSFTKAYGGAGADQIDFHMISKAGSVAGPSTISGGSGNDIFNFKYAEAGFDVAVTVTDYEDGDVMTWRPIVGPEETFTLSVPPTGCSAANDGADRVITCPDTGSTLRFTGKAL